MVLTIFFRKLGSTAVKDTKDKTAVDQKTSYEEKGTHWTQTAGDTWPQNYPTHVNTSQGYYFLEHKKENNIVRDLV